MRNDKIAYLNADVAAANRSDSTWTTEHDGQTIDVDLVEIEPGQWSINVSVRAAGWSDCLRFTNREAARIAGERIGMKFVDDLC